jgi:hypothetical protein
LSGREPSTAVEAGVVQRRSQSFGGELLDQKAYKVGKLKAMVEAARILRALYPQ